MFKGIKCGTCLDFAEGQENGKIKTSRACGNWRPNWELLNPELKKVRMLLSKLSPRSFEIFSAWWNEERIEKPFNDTVGQRCGACAYFLTCKFKPKRPDRPEKYYCQEWDLDLVRKRTSKHCQKELRRIVKYTRKLPETDVPYLALFIQKQAQINLYKTVDIGIGDKVLYKQGEEVLKCRVVDLTEEHAILEYKRKAIIQERVLNFDPSKGMNREEFKKSDEALIETGEFEQKPLRLTVLYATLTLADRVVNPFPVFKQRSFM